MGGLFWSFFVGFCLGPPGFGFGKSICAALHGQLFAKERKLDELTFDSSLTTDATRLEHVFALQYRVCTGVEIFSKLKSIFKNILKIIYSVKTFDSSLSNDAACGQIMAHLRTKILSLHRDRNLIHSSLDLRDAYLGQYRFVP